ncbi:ATP-binding protein [Streptomyces sp. NPDC056465]|uniref:ATP-binding protein n=1 Tax=unclassified Streptomyces TaxID=2593676 RepID=UPI0035E213E5
MSVTTPSRPPARGLNALSDLSAHVVAVMERGGADIAQLGVPAQPASEDGLWEDLAVPKARAARNAWRNSMLDAAHDEYLDFRFPSLVPGAIAPAGERWLEPNQKPNTMRNWLGSLLEAKKQKARPEVLNMIVPGNIGTGKTAAICALGNEAAAAGLSTLYVKHATYLTYRRPNSAPHNLSVHDVRRMFVSCELLILDELCGEMDTTATEAARRETVDLIDSRLAAGRPTAFSTNLKSRSEPGSGTIGVVDVLGERLLSRLEARAHLVKILGEDRRKPAKPLDW